MFITVLPIVTTNWLSFFHDFISLNTRINLKIRIAVIAELVVVSSWPETEIYIMMSIEDTKITKASKKLNRSEKYSLKPKAINFIIISSKKTE